MGEEEWVERFVCLSIIFLPFLFFAVASDWITLSFPASDPAYLAGKLKHPAHGSVRKHSPGKPLLPPLVSKRLV